MRMAAGELCWDIARSCDGSVDMEFVVSRNAVPKGRPVVSLLSKRQVTAASENAHKSVSCKWQPVMAVMVGASASVALGCTLAAAMPQ